MKGHEIFRLIRTALILGGAWIGAGIFWGALFAGLVRMAFDLQEEIALLWIGIPIFIALLPFCIFVLPKHLRKAGIL